MVSSRFLLFQEARQYARNLGLRSTAEWQQWARSGSRPHYIPSRPDRTYGSDFNGHIDFLDLPKKAFPVLPEVGEQSTSEQLRIRKMGTEIFNEHLSKHVSEFEFQSFPKDSFISFLVRPRDETKRRANLWAPLQLRMTMGEPERGKIAQFTHISSIDRDFGFVGFEIVSRSTYWLPPGTVNIKSTSKPRYERFKVENSDLSAEFSRYYEKYAIDTSVGWIEKGFRSHNDTVCAKLVAALSKMVYLPLDIRVNFGTAPNSRSSNVIIDGASALYRYARRPSRTSSHVVHLHKSTNGIVAPFSTADHPQFLIVLVGKEGRLEAVYIFPKHILSDKGVLRDVERGEAGKHNMPIHLPERIESSRLLARRHRWQLDYFVDMSDPESGRKRFMEIFSRHRTQPA